jgi:alpha-L-rhamnosidase
LRHAAARYESRYGQVASAWQQSDGRLTWDVTVPPGATATAYIPATPDARVSESGSAVEAATGVRWLRAEPDAVVVALASGTYQFVVAREL